MRPQLLKHVIADATWPSGDGNRVLDHQLVDFGQLGTALDGWKLLDRRAGEAFDLKRVRVVRDAIFAGIELGGDHDGKLNMITNPGTTPNYCSIEYNIWYYPFETIDQIKAEFEQYVHDVCRS